MMFDLHNLSMNTIHSDLLASGEMSSSLISKSGSTLLASKLFNIFA